MTLGVTIGMLTIDSPQSLGSKVVLPPPVGSLVIPAEAVTSVVEPVPLALMLADPAVVGSVIGSETEIEIDPIVAVPVPAVGSSLVFDLLSPHAPVRSDMKLSRHALRFISW